MYNIENLKKLRQYLFDNQEKVRAHFDMRSWMWIPLEDYLEAGYSGYEDEKNPEEKPVLAPEVELTCGTTMCIAGWAAYSGLFAEEAAKAYGYLSFANRVFLALKGRSAYHPELDNAHNFLFSQGWADNLDEAIGRISYAIEFNQYDLKHQFGFDFDQCYWSYIPEEYRDPSTSPFKLATPS